MVRVRVQRLPDREGQVVLRFEVQDQGIGIAADKLKAVFDPFTQGDASITRHFGGTGLGLAICAKLVRAMGGEIGVQSAPGRGSVFHFTARFDIDLTESNSDIMGDTVARDAQSAANALRVLLVEDNEVNQKLAVDLLEREGHEIDVASDGAQAVDLAMRGDTPYDLILMDMQMPVMDGLEATRRIRAHERHTREHVRIIAMTANAMPGDRERCLAAGMDDYLSKPIRVDELRAALRWQDASFSPTTPAGLDVLMPPPTAAPAPAPAATATATASAYDHTAALAEADPLVVSVIGESFRKGWPVWVQEMRSAIAAGDAPLLQRSAHTLRGLVGNFGPSPVTELSRQIEVMGAAGNTHDATPLLQQVEAHLKGLDAALAAHLGRRA